MSHFCGSPHPRRPVTVLRPTPTGILRNKHQNVSSFPRPDALNNARPATTSSARRSWSKTTPHASRSRLFSRMHRLECSATDDGLGSGLMRGEGAIDRYRMSFLPRSSSFLVSLAAVSMRLSSASSIV